MTRRSLAAGLLGLAAIAAGCGAPSQIGADRDTFKAVDALYTAVSLRDPSLLGQCETQLRGLRESGKLPGDAASSLDAIIVEARGGSWEPAQTRLARFMEGQRRP